jgi:molybdopterin molybdotransferase
MITVAEAKHLILATVKPMPVVHCGLTEMCGRVLAADVISQFPLPPHDNSSMDGYALRSADTQSASEKNPVSLTITGMIAAGESAHCLPPLLSMQTMQIFTGAMVPASADAVIRQEDVIIRDDHIVLKRSVSRKENMRFKGEEIEEGSVALKAGETLSPAGVGLLASLGHKSASVAACPRVGILVTGSEIVTDFIDLQPGKIFDSNSHVLTAALKQMGIPPVFKESCVDDRETLRQKISEGQAKSDILLVTGGVSVGKFDHVKEICAELNIQEIFWKVQQKPGKPLFFGSTKDRQKLLFGLPGNPASVLVCFYQYVYPGIMKAMGATQPFLPSARVCLHNDFSKAAGLAHFLKGRLAADGTVEILELQGSHMMSSFARANCLVAIDESVTDLRKGDMVEIHLLPR